MSDFIKLGDLIRQISAPGDNPSKRNWRKAVHSQPEKNQPKEPGPIQRQVHSSQSAMRESVRIFRESGLGIKLAVRQFRATYINLTLADCNGNQCRAAGQLGLHRNTLHREIVQMQRAGLLTANLRGPGNYQRRKSVQRAKAQARELGVRVGTA